MQRCGVRPRQTYPDGRKVLFADPQQLFRRHIVGNHDFNEQLSAALIKNDIRDSSLHPHLKLRFLELKQMSFYQPFLCTECTRHLNLARGFNVEAWKHNCLCLMKNLFSNHVGCCFVRGPTVIGVVVRKMGLPAGVTVPCNKRGTAARAGAITCQSGEYIFRRHQNSVP